LSLQQIGSSAVALGVHGVVLNAEGRARRCWSRRFRVENWVD